MRSTDPFDRYYGWDVEPKVPLPAWRLEEILEEIRQKVVEVGYVPEEKSHLLADILRPQIEKKYVIDRRPRDS